MGRAMSRLRPFQQTAKAAIFQHWQDGRRNVLLKSPTGSVFLPTLL